MFLGAIGSIPESPAPAIQTECAACMPNLALLSQSLALIMHLLGVFSNLLQFPSASFSFAHNDRAAALRWERVQRSLARTPGAHLMVESIIFAYTHIIPRVFRKFARWLEDGGLSRPIAAYGGPKRTKNLRFELDEVRDRPICPVTGTWPTAKAGVQTTILAERAAPRRFSVSSRVFGSAALKFFTSKG